MGSFEDAHKYIDEVLRPEPGFVRVNAIFRQQPTFQTLYDEMSLEHQYLRETDQGPDYPRQARLTDLEAIAAVIAGTVGYTWTDTRRKIKWNSRFNGLLFEMAQELWRIEPKGLLMPELYPNEAVVYHQLSDGINLLLSSVGARFAHWCPDWDFMYIHDLCLEFQACTCRLERVARAGHPNDTSWTSAGSANTAH